MAELDIGDIEDSALLIPFAVCTVVLVLTHLLSLMIATCLLPDLDALASIPKAQLAVSSSHISRSCCVSFSWALSHILGMALFIAEIVLIGFVKFFPITRVGFIGFFDGKEQVLNISHIELEPTNFENPSEEIAKRLLPAFIALGTVMVLVVFCLPVFVCYYFRFIHRYRIKDHRNRLEEAEKLFEKLKDDASSERELGPVGPSFRESNLEGFRVSQQRPGASIADTKGEIFAKPESGILKRHSTEDFEDALEKAEDI